MKGKVEICTILAIGDDDPLGRKVGDKIAVEWPNFSDGCGYECTVRDWESGTCERHGPTEVDKIVERTTEAFRGDLASILSSNPGGDDEG